MFGVNLIILFIVTHVRSSDVTVDPKQTNCFNKWGGTCISKEVKRCPFSDGSFSWEGCPDDSICCIPSDKESNIEDIEKEMDPEPTCGHSAPDIKKYQLLNGLRPEPHQWPWVVSLKLGNMHKCSGTIIESQWILTAAHCFYESKIADDWSVIVAEHDLFRREVANQKVSISKIIIHPNSNTPLYSHDVALIQLKEDIQFNEKVDKICLPENKTRHENRICTVAGWGDGNFDFSTAQFLQEITLRIVSDEKCKKAYGMDYHDHNVCAGFSDVERNRCLGDSGGPLMCPFYANEDKYWKLVGIVSWGNHCQDSKHPGIYTKVSSFVPWIHETMNKFK